MKTRNLVAYGIADEEYQEEIPAGTQVAIYENPSPGEFGDLFPDSAWEIEDAHGRTAIVPSGSVSQYDLIAAHALAPLSAWECQCHAASIKLVDSGVLGPSRVARGSCTGVPGQHSWVVIGDDCYTNDAIIVDPTLWSYDDSVQGVWVGTYRLGKHRPFGKGSIWDWGRPDSPTDTIIELTPSEPLSAEALDFLRLLGPLDHRGWSVLAHAPVGGWPSGEIIAAMYNTQGISQLIPIDIVGMNTDINPGGLYLPTSKGTLT